MVNYGTGQGVNFQALQAQLAYTKCIYWYSSLQFLLHSRARIFDAPPGWNTNPHCADGTYLRPWEKRGAVSVTIKVKSTELKCVSAPGNHISHRMLHLMFCS